MNTTLSKLAIASGALLLSATLALAAVGYSFFGEADYSTPGNASMRGVSMTSDADPGFGGLEFDIAPGTTFGDLATLAADFNATACGGGSPRFSIGVLDEFGNPKNIFAYLGDHPNYACTANTWISSGDLLETGKFVDTGQVGGTFYHDYDDAVADFGDLEVTTILLVVDSSWLFGSQTVMADNVDINGTIHTFEPTAKELKEQCKKGGWTGFDGSEESGGYGPFKNQGQCVSTFAKMQND